MEVEGNYVDSHGHSEVGFGITRLLGFDLLPWIKRINKMRLYRPAAGEPDAYPRRSPWPPYQYPCLAMTYPWLQAPASQVAATAQTLLGWTVSANGVSIRLTELEVSALT